MSTSNRAAAAANALFASCLVLVTSACNTVDTKEPTTGQGEGIETAVPTGAATAPAAVTQPPIATAVRPPAASSALDAGAAASASAAPSPTGALDAGGAPAADGGAAPRRCGDRFPPCPAGQKCVGSPRAGTCQ